MPKNKKLSIRVRSGVKRRSRRSTARRSSVRVNRFVMPPVWMCRLQYADCKAYAGTVGTTTRNVYRANDLYDPDSTGTGHQPSGFDQLTPFYGRFYVTSSRISLRPLYGDTTSQNPGVYGVVLTPSGTWTTSLSLPALYELPPNRVSRIQVFGQTQPCLWKTAALSFNSRDFFAGRFRNDKDLTCTDAASPDLCSYYEVFTCSIAALTCGTIYIVTHIEYTVECSELRALDAS